MNGIVRDVLIVLTAGSLATFAAIGFTLWGGGPTPRWLRWVVDEPGAVEEHAVGCRFGDEDCIDAALAERNR
jgi:hypothetical protein